MDAPSGLEAAVPEPVSAPRGTYRRLAANTGFRRLWVSQFVSGIGDWLVIGFLMPLVTSLSGGSSFAVAGILIAKLLPALVLSSLTGVMVDKFDRRRLMIVCDLVRATLTLGLLFTNSLALIYLIVLLMEIGSLFFYPAKNALIPHLVAEEDVAVANGLSYTTQQAAMLVGLTASGAMLALFERAVRIVLESGLPLVDFLAGPFAPALLGPRAGVFLNSLTFLVSAAFIASIPLISGPTGSAGRFDVRLIGADVVDAFRFLRDHRELRSLLVTIGLAIFGGGAIVTIGLVFVPQQLVGGVPFADEVPWLEQLAAAPISFMLVFLATGMVGGALIVPRLAQRLTLQLLFLGGVGGFGVAMFTFALARSYVVAGLLTLVAGVCIATITVAGNTYVVATVDDEIRGRVFTALESVIKVSLLGSMLLMAPLGDLIARGVEAILRAYPDTLGTLGITGPQVALQAASLVVLAAAVYAFRTLEWRRCEEVCGDE
jgi:dTMP kinase